MMTFPEHEHDEGFVNSDGELMCSTCGQILDYSGGYVNPDYENEDREW
jgi:hypothetical protein